MQAQAVFWLPVTRQESLEVDKPDEFCRETTKDPVGRGGRSEGVAVSGAASVKDVVVTVTVGLYLLARR